MPAVANDDLGPRGARLTLRQALNEHRDLAPRVRLGTYRQHRRAFGDRYRLVITGDHQVEHGLGQRGFAAEPLVDAFRRDSRVRGDRGDRRRPEPVPLEQVTSRQHHGEAPGAGLLAPPGRVVGPHWFRIEDDQIIEHWANRDDLGTARQLGWIPPTPAYLFKMARAKRRAKRL